MMSESQGTAPSKSASKETSNDQVEEGDAAGDVRKRKRAILFGYSGAGFSGLQTQQGGVVRIDWDAEAEKNEADQTPDTIEDALFKALCLAGAISESNRESFQKISWTRSARTDRGVHAASQVVSAKLEIPGVEVRELGGDVSREDEAAFVQTINKLLPPQVRVYRIFRVNNGFNARKATTSRTYGYFLPERALKRADGSLPTLTTLRDTLRLFEGSHPFHNFTEKLSPNDPRARRVIESFTVDTIKTLPDGTRILVLQVKGQSFLKHHIRRMVGFIVECLRRDLDVNEHLRVALDQKRVLSSRLSEMPTAPAEGLFLDIAYFDFYNESLKHVANSQAKHDPTSAASVPRQPIDFIGDETVRIARENLVSEIIMPAIFNSGGGAIEAFEQWLCDRDSIEFPPYFAELDLPNQLQEAQEFLRLVERNRVKRIKTDWRILPATST